MTIATAQEVPRTLRVPDGQERLDRARYNPASFVLLAPAGALLAAMFLLPVLYAIYLGFTNLELIGLHSVNYRFTGWSNVNFLLGDTTFYQSLWLTVVFVVGSGAIGATLLGLVMAIAMQDCMPSVRFIAGALAIMAWTLPPTTIAFVWIASSTQSGVFAMLLGDRKLDLLYGHAMLVVSVANAWSLAGLSVIMFSAALRNIPGDILEAGTLEGASARQRLMRITIPLLKPTIVTCSLLMTLLTFGNFALIYLMTAGGPGNDTNILPVYSYLEGFKFHKLGYSALLGNVIVIMSAVMGAVFVYAGKSRR